jgi:hypothetical protein
MPPTAPLTIYYVAVDDNGISGPLIGCGDSLVATTTAPVRFTDQVRPSIETLLANKSRDVGLSGLVNVLYQSNLTYAGVELNGSTITVYLTGKFMLGGVCDIPRAKAQLEYTAMAAAGATSAQVFVNGRPIDEGTQPQITHPVRRWRLMRWDLGIAGLGLLAAMSLGFGLVSH